MALKTDLLGLIDQRVISLTRLLVQSRIGIKSYNEIKYLKVPTYEQQLAKREPYYGVADTLLKWREFPYGWRIIPSVVAHSRLSNDNGPPAER